MNILFIVPYVPNLIRVRPYNLIRSLSRRGHRLSLLTLYSNDQERSDLDALDEMNIHVNAVQLTRIRSLLNSFLALPSSDPLQSVYCWQPELARIGLRLLSDAARSQNPFDVIHIEHLRGAKYGLFLQKGSRAQAGKLPPIVWDSVDSISHLFRQAAGSSKNLSSKLLTRFELGRTERYEAWLLGKFSRVVVTSQVDRQALLSLPRAAGQDAAPVDVIFNGVDLEYFAIKDQDSRQPATLVMSGKMSYHANINMALYLVKEIMPLVWQQRPDIELQVVGKDPAREILALAQANPRIKVTGTVSDLRPYLARASAAVAPITYGAGVQNKVLEAMASAAPVISSSKAVSALQVRPGEDLLIADNPAEFAAHILNLLADKGLQARIGQAGRRYVEKHHHWDAVAGKFEDVYEAAASRRVPSTAEQIVSTGLQRVK
jgi:polysaccharide biosynthesis protein PslH